MTYLTKKQDRVDRASARRVWQHMGETKVSLSKRPIIVRAKGNYYWDTEGKRYLDGVAGQACCNLGHANGEVIAAMTEQLKTMDYSSPLYTTNVPNIELAEKLVGLTGGAFEKVFFMSSGSDASETAIKMAVQYQKIIGHRGKYKVIGRWLSYHGASIGALSASGYQPRRVMFEPLLINFPHIEPPYCYRCPLGLTYPSCGVACAELLEKQIKLEGEENIAAFIVEPIGAAGAILPPREYLKMVREICDRHGILLIFDEIISGFGRTGKMFAYQHYGVEPDIMILGKAISAGYAPLSAVLVNSKVAEPFLGDEPEDKFQHGMTYGGHAVACAAALTSLDIIERENLVERARVLGDRMLKRASEVDIPFVGDVRGKGLFLGMELVKDKVSKGFTSSDGIGAQVASRAMERGLKIFGMQGFADQISDVLLAMPPLTITQAEADFIVDTMEASIKDTEAKLGLGGQSQPRGALGRSRGPKNVAAR